LTTRKDVDIARSEQGKDYYVRIKDVVDRINLRNCDFEATLADRFRRAISKPKLQTKLSPTKRNTVRLSLVSAKPDLSWKDGGKQFPKKSSMIGEDYQVSTIPAAGSYTAIGNRDSKS
jgi:hypothetical protein